MRCSSPNCYSPPIESAGPTRFPGPGSRIGYVEFAPGLGPIVRAKASITVARPITEVFDFVVDVANMPRWMTGVRNAVARDETMHVGSRFRLDYMGGWRANELEVVVTEFDRPHAFASQIERGPFAFEGKMTFTEAGDATEVTNSIEAGPDSLASRIASLLFGWMLRGSMSKRLLGELQALQHNIEGDSSIRT